MASESTVEGVISSIDCDATGEYPRLQQLFRDSEVSENGGSGAEEETQIGSAIPQEILPVPAQAPLGVHLGRSSAAVTLDVPPDGGRVDTAAALAAENMMLTAYWRAICGAMLDPPPVKSALVQVKTEPPEQDPVIASSPAHAGPLHYRGAHQADLDDEAQVDIAAEESDEIEDDDSAEDDDDSAEDDDDSVEDDDDSVEVVEADDPGVVQNVETDGADDVQIVNVVEPQRPRDADGENMAFQFPKGLGTGEVDPQASDFYYPEETWNDKKSMFRRALWNPPFRRPAVTVQYYTVQCVACHKWRWVPNRRVYEYIREMNLDWPFRCEYSRAWSPGSSCRQPAEVEAGDVGFVWAMDKASIRRPPPGWERKVVIRGEGSRIFADIYYRAPDQKLLRSLNEVGKYLTEHPECGAPITAFDFTRPRPFVPPVERKRRQDFPAAETVKTRKTQM